MAEFSLSKVSLTMMGCGSLGNMTMWGFLTDGRCVLRNYLARAYIRIYRIDSLGVPPPLRCGAPHRVGGGSNHTSEASMYCVWEPFPAMSSCHFIPEDQFCCQA